jgi:beta-1,2-mannobiose phosphorylase / 1,2-beta-oligomannan phosphorylase
MNKLSWTFAAALFILAIFGIRNWAVAGPQVITPETSSGWLKYQRNPVLGGRLGTCFDISVLKKGGKYLMWFSWRPKQSIALVKSSDGIHWSAPVIVLGPNPQTDWEADINRPVVIEHAGRFQMWYTGQARGHSWIGYATSQDGIHWRRMSPKPVLAAEAPWEKVAVMCPDVLWDGRRKIYRMWYSGGGQYEPNAIGYATSRDGIHWTKAAQNPVFESDPRDTWEQQRVTGCQVIFTGGWYYMFYIGFRDINHAEIGLARSKNGLSNWQRLPENPIIRTGAADEWDHDACYKPYAVWDGAQDRWLLWYNGRNGQFEQIGLAIHRAKNLGFSGR